MNSAVRSDQPRVSSHLSLSSCFSGHTVLLRSPSPGSAVSPPSTDRRCVDCELSPKKEARLQPPSIVHVRSHQVPNRHVGGYSATCFTAHSRCNILHERRDCRVPFTDRPSDYDGDATLEALLPLTVDAQDPLHIALGIEGCSGKKVTKMSP